MQVFPAGTIKLSGGLFQQRLASGNDLNSPLLPSSREVCKPGGVSGAKGGDDVQLRVSGEAAGESEGRAQG